MVVREREKKRQLEQVVPRAGNTVITVEGLQAARNNSTWASAFEDANGGRAVLMTAALVGIGGRMMNRTFILIH